MYWHYSSLVCTDVVLVSIIAYCWDILTSWANLWMIVTYDDDSCYVEGSIVVELFVFSVQCCTAVLGICDWLISVVEKDDPACSLAVAYHLIFLGENVTGQVRSSSLGLGSQEDEK
jgi:hypothetical protein